MTDLKFKNMLLLTDVDFTALCDDKSFSKKNAEAVAYFKESGGLFSIATGRSIDSLKKYLPALSPNAPCILYNGALIYDYQTGKRLYKGKAATAPMRRIVKEIMEVFPESGVEIYNEDGVHLVRQNDVTENHIVREKLAYFVTPLDEIPGPYYKAIIADEAGVLLSLEEFAEEKKLFRRFSSLDFVYSESRFYEIMKKGVTKGSALLHFAKLFGIPPENTFAVGDNFNDTDMLKKAGLSFAVANAVEEAKLSADIIISDNNSDALFEVIDYLDKRA